MSKKQILIIHLSRLGDMIQSLPAVKLLKENHPDTDITYLALKDFSAPLEKLPWIDKLLALSAKDVEGILTEGETINHESFERLFNDFDELKLQYDVLINMTHDRGSSYLTKMINAKEKRGRVFSQEGEIVMAGKWAKYLFAAARNRTANLLNLVDIYMGMAGVQNKPVSSYLPTDNEVDRQCIEELRNLGFDPKRLAVGFQMGASKSFRTWPTESFARLAELLADRMGAQIVLFGSPQERKLGDQFSATPAVINLMGKTSLETLPSYLKCVDVLVSNDTGPMHVAAAVNTRVVGIFISTAYFRMTGPYGAGHIAVQSNYPCAPCQDSTVCAQPLCREIPPEVIWQGVKMALAHEDSIVENGGYVSFYCSEFDRNGTMFYKSINDTADSFLPRLKKYHDFNSTFNQELWNSWLGINKYSDLDKSSRNNNERKWITNDYINTCLNYHRLYSQGGKACRKIIDEFHKTRPRMRLIKDMIARLEIVEAEVKKMGSALPLIGEIHELYSAETGYSNFPLLADDFLKKYRVLHGIIESFESRIETIRGADRHVTIEA